MKALNYVTARFKNSSNILSINGCRKMGIAKMTVVTRVLIRNELKEKQRHKFGKIIMKISSVYLLKTNL